MKLLVMGQIFMNQALKEQRSICRRHRMSRILEVQKRRVNEEATSVEFLPRSQTILPPATGALGFILNPSATLSPTVAPAETFHGIPDLVHVAQGSSATRKVQFRAGTETSHKTAFLLRHFSEVTGR
ncbi:MAG: hypothetical protein L6R42_010484, partial [Xanthoria sp. 1 TBL-2021]